ncbi:MAG: transcription termination factor NusA [Chloroflexi bacterium]|nr:transcription termination factor NusA [Chloroflexota bacterium]
MKSDFLIALTQLAAERNLPREMVIQAIEAGLISAYRKDSTSAGQNITVRLNPATGEVRVFVAMQVVEEVTEPKQEFTLAEAKKVDPKAVLDSTVEIEITAQSGGRIAAQTAKQVVMQRLREAERELVFDEYIGRADEMISGTIQRIEPRQIIVDLGRAEAVLIEAEQVSTERYRPGQRLKVHIVEVRRSARGPEIVVSRSHKNLLLRLFEMEVPEIANGIVEIKAIAREAGSRSKVAVWAKQEGVDPVGSCVGLRGIRIQNIVNELQGEKIDVVPWSRDIATFIANSLSPSQPIRVDLDEGESVATVIVPDKQLSLAIGREGQNARLAAKLTGWKVDIKSSSDAELERFGRAAPEVAETVAEDEAEPAVAEETTPTPAEERVPEVAVVAEQPESEEADKAAAEEPLEQPEPEVVGAEASAPSGLSPEEELAALSLEGETATPVEEEEVEAIPITDDEVWDVPQLVPAQGASQIRFAEDIMVPRAGGGRRGRRRGGDGETAKARKAAARKSKAAAPSGNEGG